ncbi:MAG TPA: hypothetical protein VF013_04135 [Candidatus Limnocylindria bacterium]
MNPWGLQDMAAYRGAAERLVQGQPLYPPPGPILDSSDVYRYAPWFALLWVPLVAVPESWVAAGWSLVLVAASIGAVLPLLRDRQPLPVSLAVLGFVLCLRAAAIGKVEPLMVAALVHGVERRSGPLWIALAASLKVGPLALVLVYIGRGEWARVAWTALLTAAFVAPMLLFDLSHYRTEAGASMSLLALAGPLPWIAAVCVAGAVTVLVARTRWAWPAACVTALLALPRLGFYNLPLLLVGAAGGANRRHSPSAGSASR